MSRVIIVYFQLTFSFVCVWIVIYFVLFCSGPRTSYRFCPCGRFILMMTRERSCKCDTVLVDVGSKYALCDLSMFYSITLV